MITLPVKQFFNNKVTIQLKNGHKFQGLLSKVDYKNQTLALEDVQDLGNQTDKNFIPHDKKIADKTFECDNIEQILFKEKHFCEPKKYIKGDFWDATSEPVPQQPKYKQKSYGQRNEKPYYQKKPYDNRDNRGDNRGGDNRRREYNNYNRGGNDYRNYNQNGNNNNNQYRKREQNSNNYQKKEQQSNDRDYR